MTLKQLEYLVKVMEFGSITQAAMNLGVTQPNLTKAISGLEEEYGIQILIRKPRGVEFTQQGRDFVLYARGVLAAVNTYPRSGPAMFSKARLFIAAQQLDFIYPLLLRLYHSHASGNLFFNLVESDRSSVVDYILKGQADIGFAVRTSVDNKDVLWNREAHRLDIRVVDKGHAYIAVGPRSPYWNRETVKLEELTGCLQVAVDMEEQAKQSFWFEQGQYNYFNNNRIIFVNTASACKSFLLGTDAISFCSSWTRGCFNTPDIHIIPVAEDNTQHELLLITRKGEALTPEGAEFAASVYDYLGNPVPEDIPEIRNTSAALQRDEGEK